MPRWPQRTIVAGALFAARGLDARLHKRSVDSGAAPQRGGAVIAHKVLCASRVLATCAREGKTRWLTRMAAEALKVKVLHVGEHLLPAPG